MMPVIFSAAMSPNKYDFKKQKFILLSYNSTKVGKVGRQFYHPKKIDSTWRFKSAAPNFCHISENKKLARGKHTQCF